MNQRFLLIVDDSETLNINEHLEVLAAAQTYFLDVLWNREGETRVFTLTRLRERLTIHRDYHMFEINAVVIPRVAVSIAWDELDPIPNGPYYVSTPTSKSQERRLQAMRLRTPALLSSDSPQGPIVEPRDPAGLLPEGQAEFLSPNVRLRPSAPPPES